MLTEYPLDIQAEISYAKKWAFGRNPQYFNFDDYGGDCTNFVSQCLYAGGAAMNFTPDTGWYYNSSFDRSAAWTGVEYFYNFVINNRGTGIFGETTDLKKVRAGDVIQLFDELRFHHSMLVIDVKRGVPYIASHTNDAFNKPLSAYRYEKIRCIHITGARKYI